MARRLAQAGFALVASAGNAASLEAAGLRVETALKVHESRTNIEAAIRSGEIPLVINTPTSAARPPTTAATYAAPQSKASPSCSSSGRWR